MWDLRWMPPRRSCARSCGSAALAGRRMPPPVRSERAAGFEPAVDQRDRRRSIVYAQRAKYHGQVDLDGPFGDPQFARDHLVGPPAMHEPHDLLLSRRQVFHEMAMMRLEHGDRRARDGARALEGVAARLSGRGAKEAQSF